MEQPYQIEILERYKTLRKERNMLKSMLKHLEKLSEEDIIESMNYEKPEDDIHHKCINGDRTAYIATNYKLEFHKKYETELRDCFDRFMKVDKELAMYDAALEQLPHHLLEFAQIYLIEEQTWDYIQLKLSISHTCISKYRKKIATHLLEWTRLLE